MPPVLGCGFYHIQQSLVLTTMYEIRRVSKMTRGRGKGYHWAVISLNVCCKAGCASSNLRTVAPRCKTVAITKAHSKHSASSIVLNK